MSIGVRAGMLRKRLGAGKRGWHNQGAAGEQGSPFNQLNTRLMKKKIHVEKALLQSRGRSGGNAV